jgi:metal-responsive CopG/Arc/MetJ family transcriptional regulator
MGEMKVGVSLPDDLLSFADQEAVRRGTTRSGLLAQLLEEARVADQVRRYIDVHGWVVAEDDAAWWDDQRSGQPNAEPAPP